jgi:hypothetical protein
VKEVQDKSRCGGASAISRIIALDEQQGQTPASFWKAGTYARDPGKTRAARLVLSHPMTDLDVYPDSPVYLLRGSAMSGTRRFSVGALTVPESRVPIPIHDAHSPASALQSASVLIAAAHHVLEAWNHGRVDMWAFCIPSSWAEVGKWKVGSCTAVRGRLPSGGTAGMHGSGCGRGCWRERWL